MGTSLEQREEELVPISQKGGQYRTIIEVLLADGGKQREKKKNFQRRLRTRFNGERSTFTLQLFVLFNFVEHHVVHRDVEGVFVGAWKSGR